MFFYFGKEYTIDLLFSLLNFMKIIIFDLDGTLLDTRKYIIEAFSYTLGQNGIESTDKDIATLVGRNIHEIYAILAPGLDSETLFQTHAAYQAKHQDSISLYDGVSTLLTDARSKGYKLVAITNRKAHVITSLERVGLQDAFDMILSGNDVAHVKPDTEGIDLIAQHFNCLHEDMIVVGDTEIDVVFGKEGGVRMTIAITHGFRSREILEKAHPDHIVDGLEEIKDLLL